MMYAFLIPYCLGGIAGPALQSMMSAAVPDNEQGELQGALTSLISLTSIFGPLLMTGIFSYFIGPNTPFYFPGSSFFVGGVMTIISGILAYRALHPSRRE
jgi:DHA1 family tetracycline resistance protein-like MFS transporter